MVLRELSDELAKPLATVLKKSLSSGTVPNDWKTANVTPIYKKGKKSDPSNYRPVSLTSISCKLLRVSSEIALSGTWSKTIWWRILNMDL
jgi:hypothetical protein